MAFTDLFKKLINASDDEYDEATEENTAEGFETTSFSSARDYSVDEPKVTSRARRQATYSNDPSRVVDIRTTAMLQVVLLKIMVSLMLQVVIYLQVTLNLIVQKQISRTAIIHHHIFIKILMLQV